MFHYGLQLALPALTNQELVLPLISPCDSLYSSNQHIWPNQTSFEIYTLTYQYQGLAYLQ